MVFATQIRPPFPGSRRGAANGLGALRGCPRVAPLVWACILAMFLGVGGGSWAEAAEAKPRDRALVEGAYRSFLRRHYETSRAAHLGSKTNVVLAVAYGRAAFDWADAAATSKEREAIATEAVAALRLAELAHPGNPGVHFYLATNLGQLAQTKTLGALKLVREMERHFLESARLDPKFNHASAHRSLGILYNEAPGWPASVGNRAHARGQLETAVKLAPRHPDNWISLMEVFRDAQDWKALAEAAPKYEALIPELRLEWTGPEWEKPWLDWDDRFAALTKELARHDK
jgi:tetratricopeptide (TPR) repeat protein